MAIPVTMTCVAGVAKRDGRYQLVIDVPRGDEQQVLLLAAQLLEHVRMGAMKAAGLIGGGNLVQVPEPVLPGDLRGGG